MSAFPIRLRLLRAAAVATTPNDVHQTAVHRAARVNGRLRAIEAACHRFLVTHSIAVLRISLGVVFLLFGALKFFPGVSPAQGLVEQTTHLLTFGLMPAAVALALVAAMECAIGLCLIIGRLMRPAIYLLGAQMVGILSPLVLLTGRLFDGPHGAPTLEGQYVLKDVILVAATLVVAATVLGGARLSTSTDKVAPA